MHALFTRKSLPTPRRAWHSRSTRRHTKRAPGHTGIESDRALHLALQAAGYWRHVRHHLERGDLSRYGYFPAYNSKKLPRCLLVAPALRFHPATDELLRSLAPEVEIVRVGLAESWRRGVRVVMRQ